MNDILARFSYSFNPTNFPVLELGAIWLTKAIKIKSGSTMRISKGDMVMIENDRLTDLVGIPTHEIVKCYGKTTSDFSIQARNLVTSDLITLNNI